VLKVLSGMSCHGQLSMGSSQLPEPSWAGLAARGPMSTADGPNQSSSPFGSSGMTLSDAYRRACNGQP